jgi:ATP/maltotriose-dependent transcriptional regulator MalT
LAGWLDTLAADGFACGWLTLDPDDDDPARLMRHLIAAFQAADPRLGQHATGELAGGLSGSVRPALESLAADLATVDRRIVLFLDDLHCLTSPETLGIVDWLVNYSPRTCRYVIGSRDQPRLSLGALRVRRRLLEFNADQLQFSGDDARAFYASRLDRPLAPGDLDRLLQKTEGWPAALELAAIAMRAGPDRAAVIDGFAGQDLGVVEYLSEVVSQSLEPRLRAFMVKIAAFDRISAPMAAAVTGEPDAATLLERIHAANLFLAPLDRAREWYRFHALAADFLRDRLKRDGGDLAATLLVGAKWLHRAGLDEEAVNAALRAQAWEQACRWAAEAAEPLVYLRGQHQTILRWMQRLPAEWVDRFPTIRIHYAHALAFSPQRREVQAQLQRLEHIRDRLAADPSADRAQVEHVACAVDMQTTLSQALSDRGAVSRAAAEAWLERWPDAPAHWRGTMSNVFVMGLKAESRIDEGLAWASKTRALLARAESWYSASWTEYLAALLQVKRGAYFEARQTAEEGVRLLDQHLDGHPSMATFFHAILATVAYEFDELDRAAAHIERCMPRVAEHGQADAVLMGFLTQAKLERVRRSEQAGLDKLREGQELGARRGFERVTISLAAAECSWHGGAGRFEEARAIAVRHGFDRLPSNGTGGGLHDAKSFLVASRYLLRQSSGSVLAAIDAPLARCREFGLFRRGVELLLIKAMALRHHGELQAATEALKQALIIAAPRNYFRTILDESPDLVTLFDRLEGDALRGSEAAPLARRLVQRIREAALGGALEPEASSAGMVEELSKREIAIVKRLESDLSNREIAEALFISEGTLKWHLHNIYGKLGVKNRSGAVSRARTMQVLA